MVYGIRNMNKILIINICKERLHYFEFVKPLEDILKKNNIKYFTIHYKKLRKKDLEKTSKIIICGTSLKDNEFTENINKFLWIKNIKKSILGICGGMQLIGLEFKGRLKKRTEIGFYKENFKIDFLGLNGENEVYHLHNNYIALSREFEIFSKNKIIQAVKHKAREIYCVLFHPEVRNKKMILNFVNK